MKNFLILLALVTLTQNSNAQSLDLTLLDKLIEISLADSDEYMSNYYGFERIHNKNDNNKRTYARYYNNDHDSTIVITILFLENKTNILEVSLAKNFKIENIKREIQKRGYIKQNALDFKFYHYKKGKSKIEISQIPNSTGKIKLKLTSET